MMHPLAYPEVSMRPAGAARQQWRGMMPVLVALLCMLLAGTVSSAMAQTASPPLAQQQAAQVQAGSGSSGTAGPVAAAAGAGQPYITHAKERYRLFVFGDKMATGLLAGLWRVLEGDERIVARGRFVAGSGLVRLRFHDWPRAIAQVLESRPVDIGVVMLGVNDVRDIFINGQRIPFGSEEWKRAYAARVDAVIETFRGAGVALYWVGLPAMRDARLDAAARLINEVVRERTSAAGVRFIDIRPAFADADGGFVANGPDVQGRVVRLRARNGIHFIKAGNTRLAKLVADVIRRDVEQAARAPAGAAAGLALAPAEASDRPFVGRGGVAGEPVYEAPDNLPGSDAVFLARHPAAVPQGGVLAALRRSAPPGTATARLFRDGEWTQARRGRVDDFSAPAELFEAEGQRDGADAGAAR